MFNSPPQWKMPRWFTSMQVRAVQSIVNGPYDEVIIREVALKGGVRMVEQPDGTVTWRSSLIWEYHIVGVSYCPSETGNCYVVDGRVFFKSRKKDEAEQWCRAVNRVARSRIARLARQHGAPALAVAQSR